MAGGDGKALLLVGAPPTRPDDRLVSVQVDLSLQLVPQLVVFSALHVPPQQLDLLDPETRFKSIRTFQIPGLSGIFQCRIPGLSHHVSARFLPEGKMGRILYP